MHVCAHVSVCMLWDEVVQAWILPAERLSPQPHTLFLLQMDIRAPGLLWGHRGAPDWRCCLPSKLHRCGTTQPQACSSFQWSRVAMCVRSPTVTRHMTVYASVFKWVSVVIYMSVGWCVWTCVCVWPEERTLNGTLRSHVALNRVWERNTRKERKKKKSKEFTKEKSQHESEKFRLKGIQTGFSLRLTFKL